MKLPSLSAVIGERMWRAMGWACDPQPHAAVKTLKNMHSSGEARSGGQLQKAIVMTNGPYNHTRWKHMWGWHTPRVRLGQGGF